MEPGFDGGLAAHAGASAGIYALAFMFTKGSTKIHPKIEMLIAMVLTIVLNVAFEFGKGTLVDAPHAQLFPLLSSCVTGAVCAMLIHAAATKTKENPS